jgi:hypothetical protein
MLDHIGKVVEASDVPGMSNYRLWSRAYTSPIRSRDITTATQPILSHLKNRFCREGVKRKRGLSLGGQLHSLYTLTLQM